MRRIKKEPSCNVGDNTPGDIQTSETSEENELYLVESLAKEILQTEPLAKK